MSSAKWRPFCLGLNVLINQLTLFHYFPDLRHCQIAGDLLSVASIFDRYHCSLAAVALVKCERDFMYIKHMLFNISRKWRNQ